MAVNKIVGMISIGSRPWASGTATLARRYADRIGARFELLDRMPEWSMPALADEPGRPNKKAYALKQWWPGQLLATPDTRLMLVDDSCVITAQCPDAFEVVPYGQCGYTSTSSAHAQQSFDSIRSFDPVTEQAAHYMNSGVMLYDSTMTAAFDEARIVRARELLFARFPHQTLCYYMLKKARVPMFKMDKRFNTANAEPGAFIHHITGGFGADRLRVLEALLGQHL